MKWTALAAAMFLSGCVGGTGNNCWASPIRPGVADHLTDETARQILTHNETGAALCGWKP